MRPGLKIILLPMTILMLSSCKDVFYPDEIDADETIPVIIGNITEGEPPEVTITLASNYKENITRYIKNANVWITDDSGAYEELEFDGRRLYLPVNGDFTGVSGRTYMLHVETPDGNLYESTSERIGEAADRHEINAVGVDRERLYENVIGTIFTRPEIGLDVNLSLEILSDSAGYFRFETDVLTEFTYFIKDTLNPDTLIDGFAWSSSTLGNFYDVRFSYQGNTVQIVPGHNIGFLEFFYDPMQGTEFRSAPVIYAWIVSVHVFTISANVYQYFNSVRQQLDSDDALFAPVPGQIKSNLHCANNPENKVMGVFEAAMEIEYYKAFHWIDKGVFESRDLESFPEDPGEGQTEGFPPDFWISFPQVE